MPANNITLKVCVCRTDEKVECVLYIRENGNKNELLFFQRLLAIEKKKRGGGSNSVVVTASNRALKVMF